MNDMMSLEDIALATCLKSNIEIPIQYIRNGVSYNDFAKMIMKYDQPKWWRIMEVINRSKQMMVRDSLRQGWTNEKWRDEVENLKREVLEDYYSF